jgi:hypothetical protein
MIVPQIRLLNGLRLTDSLGEEDIFGRPEARVEMEKESIAVS